MTGGTVVVLGKTRQKLCSRHAEAFGGIAYVLDEDWDFYTSASAKV